MKRKRTRDLFEKPENGSERNAPAQRENVFCPKAPSENGSREIEERLTGGGGPHVRFKNGQRSSPAPEGCGGSRR